jgi:hypothetical protein
MTELFNPPAEAPQPQQDDSTIKPKPSQKSEVHPDRRLLAGFVFGPMGEMATAPPDLRGVTDSLATTATCIVLYLGWLYGRDRYMRWVITRHTCRPNSQ